MSAQAIIRGTRSSKLQRRNEEARPYGRKRKISEDKSQWAEAKWRPGEAKIGADQLGEAEMILQHLEKKMDKEAKKRGQIKSSAEASESGLHLRVLVSFLCVLPDSLLRMPPAQPHSLLPPLQTFSSSLTGCSLTLGLDKICPSARCVLFPDFCMASSFSVSQASAYMLWANPFPRGLRDH